MLLWISANITTLIVSAIVLLAVVIALIVIIRDKKNGKSSCGGVCRGCAMSGYCHQKK